MTDIKHASRITFVTVAIALASSPIAPQADGLRPGVEGGAAVQQAASTTAAETETFVRAPDALERVTWRTRTLVGDDRLTRWKFGIAGSGVPNLTFLDAVVRVDAAVVSFIEGDSTQKAGPGIPKNLDHTLTDAERTAGRRGMGDQVRMLTYRVNTLGTDADARRRTFAFAKTMGVDTVVAPVPPSILPEVDGLAQEYGVNVAVLGQAHTLAQALASRSRRMGIAADTGVWMEQGVAPRDALAAVKDRLSYLRLRDRSALGPGGRNVKLGQGAGNFTVVFQELNRLNLRPLILMLDVSGVVDAPADLFEAVAAFEATVQPAYGEYFTELSRSARPRTELVRSGPNEELLPSYVRLKGNEIKQQIEAAIPRQPYASPKKARKLLVIDACMAGMSHSTIPHANQLLESMGRITGAWTTELNNDLNNLKYPGIKAYDAVFLNSNVGELFPDPAVREGLARFVREGGGLGGLHGAPWASRNWDELGEMLGAKSAPHRIEQGVMKPYDQASQIVKPFNGKPLPFREEYYRFNHEGSSRLRWDDVRVLLAVDLDDLSIEPRPWKGYKRPDNIYPVTWIRSYGQGRTFYCSLGHMPETFMTPEIVGHLLAGVQFLLGDLEADTTPNPPLGTAQSR